jgi:hypothetical protein
MTFSTSSPSPILDFNPHLLYYPPLSHHGRSAAYGGSISRNPSFGEADNPSAYPAIHRSYGTERLVPGRSTPLVIKKTQVNAAKKIK